MPIRDSPASRSLVSRPSATTLVTIAATVRQAIRSSTVSTLNAVCAASHAQVSSNAQVCLAPGRAHGTCATTTPSSGHSTRGTAACRYAFVVPTSRVRHRLIPSPSRPPAS